MVRRMDERRDRDRPTLPRDDDPWLWVDGHELVVSSESGVVAPGGWIGAHANTVDAPIAGEFEFRIRLDEVDAIGEPVCRVEEHVVRAHVSTDELLLFDSRLPLRAPSSYCITIAVSRGDFSAARRAYLTVPDQVLRADLVPNRSCVRAGETLAFSLVNDGSTSLFFGVDYSLERKLGEGTWIGCNVEQAWTLAGHTLGPGQRVEQHAILPGRAPPGHYRVGKLVSAVATNLERTLSFEFDIAAED